MPEQLPEKWMNMALRRNIKSRLFGKKELMERMDNPEEAEFIVRFGLEVIGKECFGMEETVAQFLLSFVRACERYPAIHRVWINGIIKNWVKYLLRLANNEKKEKEIEYFFTEILSRCAPKDTLCGVIA